MLNSSEKRISKRRFWLSLTVTVAACFFLFLHLFSIHPFGREHEPKFDGTIVGLLILAVLPWIFDQIQSIKAAGFEVTRRVNAQDDKIGEQQKELNRMFLSSMEADMFDTLRNLQIQGTFTHNPLDPNYRVITEQMKHLFQRGYLTRSPDELHEHEEIGQGRLVTLLGKEFIEKRLRLERGEDKA
jgi:hypothetical protein